MAHHDYLHHLKSFFCAHTDDPLIQQAKTAYARELIILSKLDLSPATEFLESHYCPVKRRPPRDPLGMLRMLLLMLLCGVERITKWVKQLRGSPLLAALTGFAPDHIPGIGTCYAFQDRLVNGPYQKPCEHVTRPSDALKHRHTRRLKDHTDDRHDYPPVYHSESEALAAELLEHTPDPRPNSLQTRLEDLFVKLGLIPSLEAGLFAALDQLACASAPDDATIPAPLAPDHAPDQAHSSENIPLDVSGDGSPLETDASPNGHPTCDCPVEPRLHNTCTHPREYTSETAQWSFSTGRTRYVFGDRSYHLGCRPHGRDLPLLTYMGEGNEADATLSLKAMDDLLKLIRAHDLDLTVKTFSGDMHHDTYAHSDYYSQKGILTAIPLREPSQHRATPHLDQHPNLRLDADGTPLCPAGGRMCSHHYDPKKRTRVFTCPAKRLTHRQGKAQYAFFDGDCPAGSDCCPQSSLKPLVYLKTEDDPRLYPPIARDSKRFKRLYNQRTTTERLNALNDRYHLDRRARNASYGLIYLTLTNICEHAVVRFLEALKAVTSMATLLAQTMTMIMQA
jgi:hypothetical protein